MEAAILIVLPVVAIALIGYLAVRFDLISQAANDGIYRFVLAVAVPAYIFRVMAGAGLPRDLERVWEVLGSYYIGALAVLILAIVVGKFAFKGNQAEQSMIGVGSSHSNAVLLGVPAVVIILGSKLTVPLFLLIGIHAVVMALLLNIVLRVRMGKAGELPQAMWQTLVSQLKNPILLALIAGLLYAELGGPALPKVIGSTIRLLGNAAVPCALFALGGMMVRYKIAGHVPEAIAVSVLKLAVFPLIVWAMAKPVFGLAGSWTWVAVMLAMMPVSFNMHNMVKRSQRGAEAAGSAIALSTLLSAIALVALVYIIRN
jgi:malonate transporter